jgi:dTDP-4-dehydrorhamnose reductase
MKKIWICGAAGMLGAHFARTLAAKQIPFVANDYQQVDITQLDAVSNFVRAQNISHIINCAAYTQVDKAEIEQKQAYLVNAVGPYHLGIAARRHRAHVIHFSTDYVFNGSGSIPYTEEMSCTPLGAYGMSKLAGEMKLLDEYEEACIIRTSWLFGIPGKNFVETMLKLMSERDQLRIVADQVGRPTYCQDLVETTLSLLDQQGIFHFANACETSWYDFAKEIYAQAQAMGFELKTTKIDPIATHDYPTPAKRPTYSTLSTTKIEQLIDKQPRAWKEALGEYLQEYKLSQKTLQTV